MNKKMLQKTKFKRVRIQPYPYKRTLSGNKIVKEPWFVEDVTDNFIEISLQSTGHRKEIGLDHVKEFMTDSQYGSEGILILKSQLIINGNTVYIEPINSSNFKK